MAWLGTLSRVIDLRLPAAWFTLRRFEQDGRLYELLGVRLVKRLLRRGPLAVFNPHLHLPAERTPANLAALDQRMRDAEASHSILFVATLGVAAAEAAAGCGSTAGWIVRVQPSRQRLSRHVAALQPRPAASALRHCERLDPGPP